MAKHELHFSLEKETKGAYQYKETDAIGNKMERNYMIGTLYVRKDFLAGQKPQSFNVTVELP